MSFRVFFKKKLALNRVQAKFLAYKKILPNSAQLRVFATGISYDLVLKSGKILYLSGAYLLPLFILIFPLAFPLAFPLTLIAFFLRATFLSLILLIDSFLILISLRIRFLAFIILIIIFLAIKFRIIILFRLNFNSNLLLIIDLLIILIDKDILIGFFLISFRDIIYIAFYYPY